MEGPSYTKGMVQIQAWMESAEEDTENRLGPDQGKKKEKVVGFNWNFARNVFFFFWKLQLSYHF